MATPLFDYLVSLGLFGYLGYLGPIVVVSWLLRSKPINRRNWLVAYVVLFLVGFGITAVGAWRTGDSSAVARGVKDGLVSSFGLVGFFNLIRGALRARPRNRTGVLGKSGGRRASN
jgi:hypothetical protein